MIDVKIKATHKDFKLPVKATEGDSCYDVVAVAMTITENYVEYDLGFATEFSKEWEGVARPRSSISNYDLVLTNSPGTLDSCYRGSWKARFKQIKENGRIYEIGDKVVQITFQRVPEVNFILTDDLSDTQRGSGGFGSTGK